MTQRMQDLADEIIGLQAKLDIEIEKRRKVLGWKLKEQFVEFEEGIVAQHRLLRMGIPRYFAQTSLATVVTAPIIYSLIIPFVIADLWVSLYQMICFRVYQIKLVRRSDYIVFDRRHLSYLNGIEALNCAFCAYGNGLIGYIGEISSRAEQY